MSQTWDDALRASGYRVTPQRQLVLEAVTRLEHATPEEIYAEVRQTAVGVNVSTVYRTLELLEPAGILARNDATVRGLEGLPLETKVLAGEISGHAAIEMNGAASA